MIQSRTIWLVPVLAHLVSGCGNDARKAPASNVLAWGGRGKTAGLFIKPRAAAVDKQGRVFVVDMSGRIQRFGRDGKCQLSWDLPPRERGFPTGLGIDRRNGTLLVAETHRQRILRYSPDGELLAEWGRAGHGPGEFTYATDVAAGPDGRVYVTEYGGSGGARARVMVFGEEGDFLNEWGRLGTAPGEFQRPMGLDVDKEGRVFVADSVNHRVQVFAPEGRRIGGWGSPGTEVGCMKYPWDIAVTADRHVIVCEYGNNRIQAFTREGRSLGIWGKAGSGVGYLASPWGIAVGVDKRIVIVDALNHRLQVIESDLVGGTLQ